MIAGHAGIWLGAPRGALREAPAAPEVTRDADAKRIAFNYVLCEERDSTIEVARLGPVLVQGGGVGVGGLRGSPLHAAVLRAGATAGVVEARGLAYAVKAAALPSLTSRNAVRGAVEIILVSAVRVVDELAPRGRAGGARSRNAMAALLQPDGPAGASAVDYCLDFAEAVAANASSRMTTHGRSTRTRGGGGLSENGRRTVGSQFKDGIPPQP